MLPERFVSVLGAKSRDDLLRETVQFAHSLEFDFVAATFFIDSPGRRPHTIGVDNTPPDYRNTFESFDAGLRDPVAQHCKRMAVPIVWDLSTYTAAGAADRWEHQARFGYRTGIALALHLPKGRHLFIGVDRDQAIPRDQPEVARRVADLSLFALYAQEAFVKLLAPDAPFENGPALTERELESLRWTMEGKTAWEVGCILGISEQTAVRHLNNAAHKLDCVGKHHAVVKALRLGLIR